MNLLEMLRSIYHKIGDSPKALSHTETLTARQTRDFLSRYPDFREALTCSKEALQAIRDKRLRELLIYAKAHSPWYKETLGHIDVHNFTEQRLPELPIMNKTILMANWDSIVTKKNITLALAEEHIEKMNHDGDTLFFQDNYHILASSGTTGKRGVFPYDWDEWITHYSFFVRLPFYNQDRSKILIKPNLKLKVAQVVVCNTIFAMYSLSKTFNLSKSDIHYFPVTLPQSEINVGLNNFQPDMIQGTPSIIFKLCQEANSGKLNIHPSIILVTGEPLYKPIRQLIKKIWPDVNIFNTFGSSEGLIGRNCYANSEEMHLNDDGCIVEPVDEFNNPIKKGNIANKLYLTNLYNYTLPLIRYESYDQLLFLDKTCECGLVHQLIAEPQGRPEFDFYYGNIFAHHLLFVTSLLLEKNIQEYQVIQTRNGADIRIRTIGYVDKNVLKNNIHAKLSKLGLKDPEINLIEVKRFEYPISGKLKRFVKMPESD